jgi:DNA-binding MarR family transcriptional regulator
MNQDLIAQDRSEMNVLFIHSELDDAGLKPSEFRVYAHLSRRAGKGRAYPGIDSISAVCRINKTTAIEAIKHLESMGMIEVNRIKGVRNVYVLTKRSRWLIDRSNPGNGMPPVLFEVTDSSISGNGAVPNGGTKGNPQRISKGGNPSLALKIYSAYPRKIAKPAALKAIEKALIRFNDEVHDKTLLELTQLYATSVEGTEQTFIPYPQKWFNQERFNDDPATWKNGEQKTPGENKSQHTHALMSDRLWEKKFGNNS